MRKAILLTMAAAIVAMFAIPGTASGFWTKHHANSFSKVELEITGTDMFYAGEVGGVTCTQTISKVTLEVGSTGTVNTFEPELKPQYTFITEACQGTGITAGCDVHEATADSLPWTIHTNLGAPVITTKTITFTLSGFLCPHTSSLTPGEVKMTVAAGEENTTSTGALYGLLNADGPGQFVEVTGTLHVLGTITYGI